MTTQELIKACDLLDNYDPQSALSHEEIYAMATVTDALRSRLNDELRGEPVGWLYKNGAMTGFRLGPQRPDERASWSPLYAQQPSPRVADDEQIGVAMALERQRSVKISEAVQSLPIGGKNETMPTPFQSGYLIACEEIIHRLKTEEWVLESAAASPHEVKT